MKHPILTSMRFAAHDMSRSMNRNLASYHLSLRARLATRLRSFIHRCYGSRWEDQIVTIDEPPWLRSFWRWCGVPFPFAGLDSIRMPHIKSFYTNKKLVQDPDGSWWCETTYAPPPWPDIRDIIMSNLLKDVGVPQDMFVVEVTGRTMGKTMHAEALARLTQRAKEAGLKFHTVDHDYAAVEREFAAGCSELESLYARGVGRGSPGGDKSHGAEVQGGKAVVPELFGLSLRVMLKKGIDDAGGPQPTKNHMIIKNCSRKIMKPSHSILILRRSDLLPTRERVPFHLINLPDFQQQAQDFDTVDDIVFIDGVRQKVLKQQDATLGLRPYKASYFHPRYHDSQVVIDGRLVTSFREDAACDIQPGTLICEPWTEEDSSIVDPDDDVMGATVTRSGILFHDQGVFIPSSL